MTAPNTHPHCTSCAYFDDHVGNDAPPQAEDAGLCRFNPPVTQPGPDSHGLWPVVRAEDWCAHHSAANGQPSLAAE